MIKKGLVSVIMAAYNVEKFVQEAINSLQAQDYKDWELLVVNDGSKDNTAAILNTLAAADQRIQVIHQENQGVSVARNAALAQMQGEFFVVFDADDFMPQASLSQRVAYMQANEKVYFLDGIIVKKDINLKETLAVLQTNYKGNPQKELMRLNANVFIGITWMVRRVEGQIYELKKGMTHAEDLLFYISISNNQAYEYATLAIEILHYRIHNSSAMTNLEGLKKGYIALFEILKKEYNIDLSLKLYLKYRISRIMFLSFLRKREYGKAFSSFVEISTM